MLILNAEVDVLTRIRREDTTEWKDLRHSEFRYMVEGVRPIHNPESLPKDCLDDAYVAAWCGGMLLSDFFVWRNSSSMLSSVLFTLMFSVIILILDIRTTRNEKKARYFVLGVAAGPVYLILRYRKTGRMKWTIPVWTASFLTFL